MAGLLAPVRKADCFLHYHFMAERGWIARSMGVGAGARGGVGWGGGMGGGGGGDGGGSGAVPLMVA